MASKPVGPGSTRRRIRRRDSAPRARLRRVANGQCLLFKGVIIHRRKGFATTPGLSCFQPRSGVLLSRQMSSNPDSTSIFFAFPDGVLDYVCAECTALCCRGQGFAGSTKREMNFLFRKYPPLAGMVIMRESSVVTCSTPAGRCFFLRNDNLCQIEVENGKKFKPGVCLLFPFNDFYRIGKTVVVAPHFLCPLRLKLPAEPGRVEGTHAKVDAMVRETEL